MKTTKLFFLFVAIALFCNSKTYAQTGDSCNNPYTLSVNTCKDSVPMTGSEIWFSFVATSKFMIMALQQSGDLVPYRATTMVLYSGNCSVLDSNTSQSTVGGNDSVIAILDSALTVGQIYYVKVLVNILPGYPIRYLEMCLLDRGLPISPYINIDRDIAGPTPSGWPITSNCVSTPCDLVSNGNFETVNVSPCSLGDYPAQYYYYGSPNSPPYSIVSCWWSSYIGGFYMSSCFNPSPYFLGVPSNFGGANIPNHTGAPYGPNNGSYADIVVDQIDYMAPRYERTYMQEQIAPMKNCATYNVSFWVYLPQNSQGYLNNGGDFGMFISSCYPNTLNSNNTYDLDDCSNSAPAIPQITAASASGWNSHAWIQVTGQYTANGSEQWITIGNFNPTSSYIVTNNANFATAYYFLDDVSITKAAASITGNNVTICNGGSTVLTAACGWDNYSWSPGGATTSSVSVSPAATTIYTVTASDNNGCSATATFTVTVDPGPTVTIPNISICNGSQKQINPTITGGLPGYTYLWQPATGLSCTNCSNPYASPTVTTPYTLTVTDQNGCIGTASVTVTVNPTPTVTIAPPSGCISNPTLITASASGGTAPYNYLWSNGSSTNSSASITVPVPLISATYTVTVTDNNGCTATAVYTAVGPPRVNLSPNPIAICNGIATTTLNITTNEPGGNYIWSPGASPASKILTGGPASYSYNTIFTSQGTYTVTVNNGAGCSTTASITVYPAVAVTISPTPNCISSPTLITANPTGGITPYSYLWSNGSSTSSAASITIPVPAVQTTYTITVTDASGCTATASYSVGAAPTVSINPNPLIVCSGPGTAVLNITTTNPGGGYVWSPGVSPGSNFLSGGPGSYTFNETFTTSGIYTVTVNNGIGCSTTASVNVTIDDLKVFNGIADLCTNANTNCVTLNSLISGGVGLITYNWSPATYISGPTTTPNVTVCIPPNLQTTQTYMVTVTDADHCTATGTETLITYLTPVISGSPYACSPANVYTVTNAIAPFTNYTWSASNGNSGTGTSATPNFNSNGGTITFSNHGCTATFNVNPCCEAPDALVIVDESSTQLGNSVYTNRLIYINGTLTVNSPLTLLGCDVNMGPMAKINIVTGGNLDIQPSYFTNPCYTHIHAGCNEMWSSISINTPATSGVTLAISGALIEDGDSAVVSVNGGVYNINASTFNKNYKSIVLEPFSGTNNYTLLNNRIECKTFTPVELACPGSFTFNWYTAANGLINLAPHIGQRSWEGIDISGCANVVINDVNFWDNLDNGIVALNSNLTVNSQLFYHINSHLLTTGTIISTGTTSPLTFSAGTSHSSNYFKDCTNGIVLNNNFSNISIENNDFHFNIPPSNFATTTTAISVSASGISGTTASTIQKNVIDSAYTAIYCNLNLNTNTSIDHNKIGSDGCQAAIQGIVINDNGLNTAAYSVTNNKIKDTHNGIEVSNTNGTIVDANQIQPTTFSSTCIVPIGNGIGFSNCSFGQITNNHVVTIASSSEQYYGSSVTLSQNTTICSNVFKDLYYDVYFSGNCYPSGVIDNTFNNSGLNPNAVGIVLDNNGNMGTEGSSSTPSNNTWSAGYVCATKIITAAGTNVIWYKNSGSFIPIPYCTAIAIPESAATGNNTPNCNSFSSPAPGHRSLESSNSSQSSIESKEAKVYPNPANTLLNVQVDLEQGQVAQICLYNSLGQLVQCMELKDNVTTLPINALAAGIYYYRVTDQTGAVLKADKQMIIH